MTITDILTGGAKPAAKAKAKPEAKVEATRPPRLRHRQAAPKKPKKAARQGAKPKQQRRKRRVTHGSQKSRRLIPQRPRYGWPAPRRQVFGGEIAIAGNIIIRQRGTKWHPGTGIGLGRITRFSPLSTAP